jgi:hypothetical protein
VEAADESATGSVLFSSQTASGVSTLAHTCDVCHAALGSNQMARHLLVSSGQGCDGPGGAVVQRSYPTGVGTGK